MILVIILFNYLNENNLCINYNFTIIDNIKNYTYYI